MQFKAGTYGLQYQQKSTTGTIVSTLALSLSHTHTERELAKKDGEWKISSLVNRVANFLASAGIETPAETRGERVNSDHAHLQKN